MIKEIKKFIKEEVFGPPAATKIRPELGEIASGAGYRGSTFFYPYNQDDLLLKKGKTVKFYKIMHDDDKLRGTHDFKAKAVLSIDWDIKPASNSPVDIEMADFVKKENLEKLEIPFKHILQNLYDAWYYGFKVAEKVWDIRNGKVVIKNIKCKESEYFNFDTDVFDNLKPDGLLLSSLGGESRLPIDKFIIWVHPYLKDGNFYGESDYRSIFREWWHKDTDIKSQGIALQSYGEPIRKVFYDSKMPLANLNDLKAVVDNLHNNYTIYIPATYDKETKQWIGQADVNYLESSRRVTEEFNSSIEQKNTAMARRLLIGDKLGFTDSEGGSFALGKVQLNIFWMVLKEIIENTQDIINQQLIKQIIDYNYPNVKAYPKLKFHELTEDITQEKVTIIKLAIDAGLIDRTESWVRPFLKFPELEEGKILPEPKPERLPFGGFKKLKANDYTNYKQIEKEFDENEKEAVDELTRVFNEIRVDILNKATKIVESGQTKEIELEIKAKLKGDIKEILELAFLDIYTKSRKTAVEEIKKAQEKYKFSYSKDYELIPVKIKGGNIDYIIEHYAKGFDYKDRFLRDKQKQWAFYITGVESENILKKVNGILTQGVGKFSVEKIRGQIDEVFNSYLDTGKINGGVEEPYRINTIIRTNATRIYNEGRLATFQDPELDNFVKGFIWSSILDDRVTDYCEYHDGQGLKAGDPRLDSLIPAHFNCRSIFIPVFEGEDFDADFRDRQDLPRPVGFEI